LQEYPPDDHVARKIKEEIAAGGVFGDRRQQLVVIGINMDKSVVEDLLDTCLLTDVEFELGPDVWMDYENPYHEEICEEEDEEDDEEDEEEEDED
jgi:hypothetical protein